MIIRANGQIRVFAGSNTKKGGHSLKAEMNKLFQHEFYQKPWLFKHGNFSGGNIKTMFDIGMFKLKSKFAQLTDGTHYLINTVCLPQEFTSENDLNANYENTSFTGYGKVGEKTHVDELQAADFRVSPHNSRNCPFMLCAQSQLNEPHICHVSQ